MSKISAEKDNRDLKDQIATNRNGSGQKKVGRTSRTSWTSRTSQTSRTSRTSRLLRTSKINKSNTLKNNKNENLLDLIPTRVCKWTRQKDNPELVRILKPRFDTKLGEHFRKKLNLKKTYNINLDEYGTAVWRLCDGKMSVREIGGILKTQFGDEVEPLYARLAAFLKILKTNNVISLKTSAASVVSKTDKANNLDNPNYANIARNNIYANDENKITKKKKKSNSGK